MAMSDLTSEECLRLFVDSVKEYAILVLDPKGRVESWNAGAQRIHGWSAQEVIGDNFSRFFTPEDVDAGKPELDMQAAATDGRSVDEGWRLRRDGSRYWASVTLSALRDVDGNLRGFGQISREAVGSTGEDRFRGFLEAAPDAVLIGDRQGKIIFVNSETEKLFAYPRSQLIGEAVEILVPERFRGGQPANRNRNFANTEEKPIGVELELCGRRRNGSEFPIEVSLNHLQTEEGMFVSTIRDITTRKRIETALKSANRELEAFSYSVAHDLRAPLRAMNGFAQVLLDEYKDKLDAEALDCLNEIYSAALSMGGLIDGLLSLSRVTRTELKSKSLNLSNLVRDIWERLVTGEPERIVDITIQEGIESDVDPQLAHVLISNLLSNAWKFTRKVAHPRIEFGSFERDGSPVLFIKDNGAGFNMAYASKLFAPFQRLHTVGEFAGTGIGLATAQRIIQRHGGSIWGEGEVNAGATFYFTLPPKGNMETE
jgi:PAS domain S-box-containing protein